MNEQQMTNIGLSMVLDIVTSVSTLIPDIVDLITEYRKSSYYEEIVLAEIDHSDKALFVAADDVAINLVEEKLQEKGIPFDKVESAPFKDYNIKSNGHYIIFCREVDYQRVQNAIKEIEKEQEAILDQKREKDLENDDSEREKTPDQQNSDTENDKDQESDSNEEPEVEEEDEETPQDEKQSKKDKSKEKSKRTPERKTESYGSEKSGYVSHDSESQKSNAYESYDNKEKEYQSSSDEIKRNEEERQRYETQRRDDERRYEAEKRYDYENRYQEDSHYKEYSGKSYENSELGSSERREAKRDVLAEGNLNKEINFSHKTASDGSKTDSESLSDHFDYSATKDVSKNVHDKSEKYDYGKASEGKIYERKTSEQQKDVKSDTYTHHTHPSTEHTTKGYGEQYKQETSGDKNSY